MSAQKIHVIKIGGKLINDSEALERFLTMVASETDDRVVIVHGGGRKATELSALLGIPTRMVEGRRITDADTLDIAVMVYAGLINKNIVARLQKIGIKCIGLTGADGNLIRSRKRKVEDIDFGFVGDVEEINTLLLTMLLNAQLTPVLCAITHDRKGQLLNTNADTIAAQIAIALAVEYEVSLKYCFEYKGVLFDVSTPDLTIKNIATPELDELIENGTINAGMIPKLSNGFDALNGGVAEVFICGVANLWSLENATRLKL